MLFSSVKISAKAHPVFYWCLYCNNITILQLMVLLLWISETWGKPGQAQQELIPVSVAWSPLEGQLPMQYFKHTNLLFYCPWVKLCPALPLSIQWNIKVTVGGIENYYKFVGANNKSDQKLKGFFQFCYLEDYSQICLFSNLNGIHSFIHFIRLEKNTMTILHNPQN